MCQHPLKTENRPYISMPGTRVNFFSAVEFLDLYIVRITGVHIHPRVPPRVSFLYKESGETKKGRVQWNSHSIATHPALIAFCNKNISSLMHKGWTVVEHVMSEKQGVLHIHGRSYKSWMAGFGKMPWFRSWQELIVITDPQGLRYKPGLKKE